MCQDDQQEVGHDAAPLITTRGLSLPVSYLRCHSHTCVRVASAVFSQKIAESWEICSLVEKRMLEPLTLEVPAPGLLTVYRVQTMTGMYRRKNLLPPPDPLT